MEINLKFKNGQKVMTKNRLQDCKKDLTKLVTQTIEKTIIEGKDKIEISYSIRENTGSGASYWKYDENDIISLEDCAEFLKKEYEKDIIELEKFYCDLKEVINKILKTN